MSDIEFTDNQDNSSNDLSEAEVSIFIDQNESKTRSSASLKLSEASVNAFTKKIKSRVSDFSIFANSETE
ncbi:10176_t:CDS:1, partial [Ambispora gerdemannii]